MVFLKNGDTMTLLEYEGRYKNDKKSGLWVHYYDTGTQEIFV